MLANKQKSNFSIITAINSYTAKTENRLAESIRLKDTKSNRVYRMWTFSKEVENQLHVKEEQFSYMLVKNKWLHVQDYWTNGKNLGVYGRSGITIPLICYEYLGLNNNLLNELVICIINDNYGEQHFYKANFQKMSKFARKHYTTFVDTWGDEVIGLPFSLFERI